MGWLPGRCQANDRGIDMSTSRRIDPAHPHRRSAAEPPSAGCRDVTTPRDSKKTPPSRAGPDVAAVSPTVTSAFTETPLCSSPGMSMTRRSTLSINQQILSWTTKATALLSVACGRGELVPS